MCELQITDQSNVMNSEVCLSIGLFAGPVERSAKLAKLSLICSVYLPHKPEARAAEKNSWWQPDCPPKHETIRPVRPSTRVLYSFFKHTRPTEWLPVIYWKLKTKQYKYRTGSRRALGLGEVLCSSVSRFGCLYTVDDVLITEPPSHCWLVSFPANSLTNYHILLALITLLSN